MKQRESKLTTAFSMGGRRAPQHKGNFTPVSHVLQFTITHNIGKSLNKDFHSSTHSLRLSYIQNNLPSKNRGRFTFLRRRDSHFLQNQQKAFANGTKSPKTRGEETPTFLRYLIISTVPSRSPDKQYDRNLHPIRDTERE